MRPPGPVPLLRAEKLRVSLRRTEILHGIDLDLHQGEWLGIIGPNGSGKSTLLGALAGVRRHSGRLTLATGAAPRARDISLMPQNPLLPAGMSVAEYILMGRTAHLRWLAQESQRDRDIVVGVVHRLGLEEFAERLVTDLSGGEAQRVVVARALAQQAPILLLDEPTSALDPQARRGVWGIIRRMQREGRTLLLTTHAMDEAEELCDRVVIIDEGRVVALGTPQELIARHAPPLSPEDAARRRPNLEDVFLALTGRDLIDLEAA